MPSYNPNIPTGVVNLNVDYQNLRENFQTLDAVYLIDHVAYTDSTAFKGFHKTVHLTQSVGDPATVASTGILYNKEVNDGIATDYELFFKTSLGKVLQLTRNFEPKTSTNGYTFLPGGLIIQWGTTSIATLSGNVTITLATNNINFPNNIYAAYATPKTDNLSSPSSRAVVYIKNQSTTAITFWPMSDQVSTYKGFNWWAIGR